MSSCYWRPRVPPEHHPEVSAAIIATGTLASTRWTLLSFSDGWGVLVIQSVVVATSYFPPGPDEEPPYSAPSGLLEYVPFFRRLIESLKFHGQPTRES
jgi:hypothetical protein